MLKMLTRCALLLVLWFHTITVYTATLPAVYTYQLNNGLKVVVKPDTRSPVAVSQLWYNIGAADEYEGHTGLSHALEHMMFKGTPSYPAGEFSRLIAAMGGTENAFTSQDYTAYYQRIEKQHLGACLQLEADRMRNLLLDEHEFMKEIQVIQEERRLRTEDKPQALAYEHFVAAAFLNHPYRNPVIGWMNDLKNMTIADLKSWYATWYAPNNAVLVVVGDVEPEAVKALAERYFGHIATSAMPARKPVQEATQLGEKRLTLQIPAQLPYLLLGYKVPGFNSQPTATLPAAQIEQETYALEVLAGILSGGNSARLPKYLVRGEQLAASASASYDLYERWPSLLTLAAIPATGVSLPQLEQALRTQITRLQTEPVEADELARVKAQVVADQIYQQDSLFYQAMQIGILETTGLGWQRLAEYPDKIRAVTAEQVQAVAKKYLVPSQLTIAYLDPLPLAVDSANTTHKTAVTAESLSHVR